MIKATPYRKGDAALVCPKPVYLPYNDLIERTEKICCSPHVEAITLIDGDKPICIVGATKIWDGVAEIWAIISDDVSKKKVSFCKAIVDCLYWGVNKLKLHRAFVYVKADYEIGQKFMVRLGFNKECVMKQFGPDKSDFVLMARIF